MNGYLRPALRRTQIPSIAALLPAWIRTACHVPATAGSRRFLFPDPQAWWRWNWTMGLTNDVRQTWSQNSASEYLFAQDVGVTAVVGQLAQNL